MMGLRDKIAQVKENGTVTPVIVPTVPVTPTPEHDRHEIIEVFGDILDRIRNEVQRVSVSHRRFSIPSITLTANMATRIDLTTIYGGSPGFKIRPREVVIQNNSGSDIYRAYDVMPTPGFFEIPDGSTLFDDVRTDQVYIYVTIATTVNGTSDTGIAIEVGE